ncbi:MAG: SPFH domain-containing protein, partial [Planctomycetota bacterium]
MQARNPSQEIAFKPFSGYLMLVLELLLIAATILLIAVGAANKEPGVVVLVVPMALVAFFALFGFFVVEPNLGRALVLFGRYRGTVRTAGFWWTNPFTSKKPISLRAHNLNGEKLKVNDLLGNPIEIAAVVVWQVRDTAQALFDVEQFEHFVD